MNRTFPPWSYPLLLALLGIVLFFGRLSSVWQGIIGGESLGFILYISVRKRRSAAPANLVSLFPGHLLLLFAIGVLSPPPTLLLGLWTLIPVATVIYDCVATFWRWPGRVSILSGVYCIIWADLFFLLERIIKLGRGLSSGGELVVIAVFVGIGVPFLGIGVYRHLRMINR